MSYCKLFNKEKFVTWFNSAVDEGTESLSVKISA